MSKTLIHRGITGLLVAGLLMPGVGMNAKPAEAASVVQTVFRTHTVAVNDTMYRISLRYHVSLNKLITVNPQIKNPNIIWPGMKVRIPTTTAGSGLVSAPNRSASPAVTVDQNKFAAEVVKLVNAERARAGLSQVTSDSALAKVALVKAKDMNDNNYFSHTSPTYGSPFDMMRSYGIKYSYAGENIASGQRSPQQVMDAWMNSPGHRANILGKNFTKIGAAYYNGQWVQMFIG